MFSGLLRLQVLGSSASPLYHNTPHLPLLPDWLVHSILPIGPYSYINTCSLPPGILFFPKTLKMGQTSDPETLVIHQNLTPSNNPQDLKQHYDHGGSLQLHILHSFHCPFSLHIESSFTSSSFQRSGQYSLTPPVISQP
jgi:hypothetical protein